MAPPRKPWVKRNTYHVEIRNKTYNLGVPGPKTDEGDRLAAIALQKLLERLARETAQNVVKSLNTSPGGHAPTIVADAVIAFLANAEAKSRRDKLTPKTLSGYRLALDHLTTAFATRPLATLTADELERWADRPEWSSSTRHGYLGVVCTLLGWAGCPLRVRRPPKESRGAAVCLTDDQLAAVLAAIPDCVRGGQGDLKQLLVVLRETGARPQEMAPLTVEQFDWDHGSLLLDRHKTRRHTGRGRPVPITARALEVLTAQRDRYGRGLLFRTKRGHAYDAAEIVRQCGRISRRVGFRVVAYGMRHSMATAALENGVPEAVVAELLGHKGTGMLAHHYAHLGTRAKTLKDAAEKASTGKRAG